MLDIAHACMGRFLRASDSLEPKSLLRFVRRLFRSKESSTKERCGPGGIVFCFCADDGAVKISRKREIIGRNRGPNAIGKKDAETRRDAFLANLNAGPPHSEATVAKKADA
jgi:hypothetical protein